MVSNAGKYRQLCNRRRRGESWPVVPGTLEFRGIVGEGAGSLLGGKNTLFKEREKNSRVDQDLAQGTRSCQQLKPFSWPTSNTSSSDR